MKSGSAWLARCQLWTNRQGRAEGRAASKVAKEFHYDG